VDLQVEKRGKEDNVKYRRRQRWNANTTNVALGLLALGTLALSLPTLSVSAQQDGMSPEMGGAPGGPPPGAGGPPPGAGAPGMPAGVAGGATAGVPVLEFSSEAGVPIAPAAAGPTEFADLAERRSRDGRPDPFALFPSERTFEREQTTARIFDSLAGFGTYFTPEREIAVEPEVIAPAPPNLRLAGILLAQNGVSALMEFDGRTIEIFPGASLPGGEWTVVSIDAEKAIIRRRTNARPREVAVPLVSRIDLGGGGSGGGGGNSGGGRRGPNSMGDTASPGGAGSAGAADR